MDSGLIECALPPVTKRKIPPRFGRLFGFSKALKDLNALRDEVLSGLLAARCLICATLPPGQSANPEQDCCLRRLVKPFELWRAVSLWPKLIQRFTGCFVFAGFLKFFSQTARKISPLGKGETATLFLESC